MNARGLNYELWHRIERAGMLNLSYDQVNTLRRAAMTLHSWAEMECNYWIDRETVEGKIFLQDENGHRRQIADRETGALKRVETICKEVGIYFYHQTDPRGASIYISKDPLTDQNYPSGVAI